MVDIKLLNRLISKDSKAFEEFYTLKYKDAYRLAFSFTHNQEDAEDALQNAMIKVFKNIDTLQNANSFDSWFKIIVVNCAKDVLTKSKNNPYNFSQLSGEDEDFDFEDTIENNELEFNPEDFTDKADLIETMDKILSEIKEDQRICLQLFYYNDMKIKDIAEALEIPESTVKTRLRRGKEKLESVAKDYQNKGFKLYGIPALPLFFGENIKNITIPNLPFNKIIAPALSATAAGIGSTATGVGSGSTVTSAIASATTSGSTVTATKAVGTAVVAKKIVAAVVATTMVATGTGIGLKDIMNKQNKKEDKISITEFVETTIPEDKDISNLNDVLDSNSKIFSSIAAKYKENILYTDNESKTIKSLSPDGNSYDFINNTSAPYLLVCNNCLFYENIVTNNGKSIASIYMVDIEKNSTPQKININNIAWADPGFGASPCPMVAIDDNIYYISNNEGGYVGSYQSSVNCYNISSGITKNIFTENEKCINFSKEKGLFFVDNLNYQTGKLERSYYSVEGKVLQKKILENATSEEPSSENDRYIFYQEYSKNNNSSITYITDKMTNEKKKFNNYEFQETEYGFTYEVLITVIDEKAFVKQITETGNIDDIDYEEIEKTIIYNWDDLENG